MGISAILQLIANAEALVQSMWTAYNSSAMVQAKVAQMSEDDRKAHNDLVEKGMHGTAQDRALALDEMRKLTSE